MDFNDLTEEQKAKARACKTSADLIKLAQEEGIDLSDSQLEAIAGGDSAWEKMTGCNELGYGDSISYGG